MNYYQAVIQYDGTGYAGFQYQDSAPTIQRELNAGLERVVGGKLSTLGASRTDTGVHAHQQVVKLTLERAIDSATFLNSFNRTLPAQIRCLSVAACAGDFNPPVLARRKEYRYLFTNRQQVPEADRRFIANMARPLEMEKLRQCLALLSGTHDFQNFCSMGSNVKATVRTLDTAELSAVNPHSVLHGDLFEVPAHVEHCWQLRFEAKGFLKQMIRHLVSAMWFVASSKMTVAEFENLLRTSQKVRPAWRPAPPMGLHLYRIDY